MANMADATLLVIGPGGAFRDRIVAEAAELPAADRIRFLPGVPPEDIPGWTAAADVAAMPIQPTTLNHRLTTPTRLFDAFGAGTPVVASDLPGMAAIVRETGAGVLCDPTDPASIAAALRTILDAPAERRRAFREASLEAGRGPYAWQRQAERLLALYRDNERIIGLRNRGKALGAFLGEKLVLDDPLAVQVDDLPGGTLPDDLALLQQDRPVAELVDQGHVVGHQDDGLGAIDELETRAWLRSRNVWSPVPRTSSRRRISGSPRSRSRSPAGLASPPSTSSAARR